MSGIESSFYRDHDTSKFDWKKAASIQKWQVYTTRVETTLTSTLSPQKMMFLYTQLRSLSDLSLPVGKEALKSKEGENLTECEFQGKLKEFANQLLTNFKVDSSDVQKAKQEVVMPIRSIKEIEIIDFSSHDHLEFMLKDEEFRSYIFLKAKIDLDQELIKKLIPFGILREADDRWLDAYFLLLSSKNTYKDLVLYIVGMEFQKGDEKVYAIMLQYVQDILTLDSVITVLNSLSSLAKVNVTNNLQALLSNWPNKDEVAQQKKMRPTVPG